MAKRMNYSELSEITVKTQAELDAIPLDFKGRIYIDGGTPYNRIIVRNKYLHSVEARGNSSVEARGNSSVEAWGNSSVVAWENSSVKAWGNSSVVALGNSTVEALGNSTVVARENSSVVAWENSSVKAWGNSSVEAWGNSSVVALGNSTVEALGNSSVVAWENSSVKAWGNSSVVAWENSSVEANANTQVVDRTFDHKIKISGNARIVYKPRDIVEFCDFYGIKHTKTKAIFYKAVRKDKDIYYSDHNPNFKYAIGQVLSEKCDDNKSENCGQGIHIAHRNWALNYGADWDNLAILEVETRLSDIVLPDDSDGKVRTSQVKVLREVPLEECGPYGKIIAKRRKPNS
jgi:hypothetical protein